MCRLEIPAPLEFTDHFRQIQSWRGWEAQANSLPSKQTGKEARAHELLLGWCDFSSTARESVESLALVTPVSIVFMCHTG